MLEVGILCDLEGTGCICIRLRQEVKLGCSPSIFAGHRYDQSEQPGGFIHITDSVLPGAE